MLLPVQTSGSKPPLFFVHGPNGVMPLGPSFAAILGPEQPLYVIHANGIDGRAPPIDDMRDMVLAYVQEIETACGTGPLLVGGMGAGSLAAIEIGRELQDRTRQIGPVILLDPPTIPPGYIKENQGTGPVSPLVAGQLYQEARRSLLRLASNPSSDTPFDPSDPNQLHLAILAGVGSLLACRRFIPSPFSGSVAVIVSAERAAGFFHPQVPWHKLLPGPRMVYALPWSHDDLLQSGRQIVAQVLQLMIEEASMLDAVTKRLTEPALA